MATQDGLVEDSNSYLDNESPPDESLTAVASVPWLAIALAVHAILLLVAWFILPAAPVRAKPMHIEASSVSIPDPPPPVQPPQQQAEFPDERNVPQDPVEDQRVVPEDDDHAEDPTNQPNHDLAKNPNDDPSHAESPHPNHENRNSSIGLAGAPGGGGGPGGNGGYFKARPRAGRNGHPENEKETVAALKWLKDHQNREGYWSATTFGDDSTRAGAKHTYNIDFLNVGKPGGDTGWESTCDVGLTGLAMLAFSGMGYDHRSGEFRDALLRAAIWLRKVQDNDGCFGSKEDDQFVYNHAIATMAMAELYGLSGDAIFKPVCQRAVDFILKAQNPGLGWRYGIRPGMNDSSVTGWMVLTLHTCELAGLQFDSSKCYDDAAKWFNMVTVDVNGYPKCGYNSPGSNNSRLRSATGTYDHLPSMDAICVMSMLFMGKADLHDRRMRSLVKACDEKDFLPQWKLEKLDYYYWYYASLALYQMGGSLWKQWERAMVSTLLSHQRGFCQHDRDAGLAAPETLDEFGSWDPVDAWGSAGGRVYATAINALTLETYYRHQRITGEDHK